MCDIDRLVINNWDKIIKSSNNNDLKIITATSDININNTKTGTVSCSDDININNIICILNNINNDTFIDFVKNYNKSNKDDDIHVIIYSTVGQLSSCEAICNCILNHKANHKSKIIVYIHYFAQSGAALIALACDKIIMLHSSLMGPCTPLIGSSNDSIFNIIDSVNFKKRDGSNIKEEWLIKYNDSLKIEEHQLRYTKDVMHVTDSQYEEFFSGKHYAKRVFSAQECKDFGLNLEIKEVFPPKIKRMVDSLQIWKPTSDK